MKRPLITVVVPTYNRAALLRRCLHALLHQSLDRDCYEIIVVDNGSTDLTAETVARVAARHPEVRYLFEPRQGISYAKNTGLEAAAGTIVAYTDDDAFAHEDWLRLLAERFEHMQPRPHVVGGPAFPLYTGRRPPWFRDSYETFSWGPAGRFLERHECFYGLNSAFRRDVLAGAGAFDTRLGMKGGALGFDEDDEVFERLWAHTGTLHAYYEPAAWVGHAIPDARVQPAYRLKRELVGGQARHAFETLRTAGPPCAGPGKASLIFSAAVLRAAGGIGGAASPTNWVVESGGRVAERLGFLIAALGLSAGARRAAL